MSIENGSASWIGKDIILEKGLTLNPNNIAIAHVRSVAGSFPTEITGEEEERFAPSIRSRYAQLGLHPHSDSKLYALDSYFSSEDESKPSEFVIPLTNLSEGPIHIKPDTKLLRFYFTPEEFIINGNLKEMVANKSIEIDGKENVDWKYVRKSNRPQDTDEAGIAFRVDVKDGKYLPYRPAPVSISGSERKYRNLIDSLLQPVSKRRNPQNPYLWIGETVPLKLHNNVMAEIRRNTFTDIIGNTPVGEEWEHIDSRLVDTSGWPIRVEIYSPTVGEEQWVVFQFFN